MFDFLKSDLNETSKICIFYFNEDDMENKLNNIFNIVKEEVVVKLHENKRLYFVELNDILIWAEFSKQLSISKENKSTRIIVNK